MADIQRSVYPHKSSPISCRLSAAAVKVRRSKTNVLPLHYTQPTGTCHVIGCEGRLRFRKITCNVLNLTVFIIIIIIVIVLYVLLEPKGFLGTPCLPGSQCSDVNAVCRSNVCLCKPTFFERNDICRMSTLYTQHTVVL